MSEDSLVDIDALIPQAPPFRYVHRVVEINDTAIRAQFDVHDTEPFAAGHFPGNPVMPGVLQLECVAQTAAVLVAARLAASMGASAGGTPVLTRINSAKFKNMVRPGDVLDIAVTVKERVANAIVVTGKTSVAGKACVIAELMLALVTAE